MDMMSEQDFKAVNMVLRERSTFIPVELEHDVAIVDLTAIDMDKLGRGLSSSSACVQRLCRAYRPDMKLVSWWLNGSQTNRKLKAKTTARVSAFNKQLDVFSISGKPYALSAKGRGNRRYLGFGVRVFGQNHTAYIHNLIGAETFARVHQSAWNSWAKMAWDEDHLTWKSDNVFHHLLGYQTSTLAGNTPLNLVLLDKWTHETTKVQYNQLRRRIIDHDVDCKNCILLPKKGAMQAIQNVPVLA